MLRSMDARKFFFDDKGHLRSAWRLCLFVVAFYICSTLGFILLFGGLGLVPDRTRAHLPSGGISWNYTTWVNLVFLVVAGVLVVRFVRSGGLPMLRMMGGAPESADHAHHH